MKHLCQHLHQLFIDQGVTSRCFYGKGCTRGHEGCGLQKGWRGSV